MANQNARFSVFVTNNLGSTNSKEAILTVLPDTIRRLVAFAETASMATESAAASR